MVIKEGKVINMKERIEKIKELVLEIENVSWDIGYDFGHYHSEASKREEHKKLVKKICSLNLELHSLLNELEESESK